MASFCEKRGKNYKPGTDTKEKTSLYIGRGFIQLNGYNNDTSFASDIRVPDVLSNPMLLEEDYAMDTAIWFFIKNNLFKLCDEGVHYDAIKWLTKQINGSHKALDHRIKEYINIIDCVK